LFYGDRSTTQEGCPMHPSHKAFNQNVAPRGLAFWDIAASSLMPRNTKSAG
jgi:hypothetical protein